MKVLQVIDSLALGGAEVLVTNLYAGLRQRGIECEYYLLRSNKTPLEQQLTMQGARIYAPLCRSVYSPLHIRELQVHLRSFRYDLAHVHLFPAQLWVAAGARLAGAAVPLITTEHNTENRRRNGWCRNVDRWTYAQYSRIASISSATTANLVAWLPELRHKIVACPNGVDVDRLASSATAGKPLLFSVPEDVPVLLCVGSFNFRKGQDILLHAASRVPRVAVALAGDGPLAGELRALADHLGIASRVQFLGKRMDIPQLLKACDLYVQPSRVDGFGIAALEAMAAGKAVIASDVPGLAQVVGDAGLLYPMGDAAALAQTIRALLSDTEMRQRLGQAAQQRARYFDIETTFDRHAELYRDVAAKGAQ